MNKIILHFLCMFCFLPCLAQENEDPIRLTYQSTLLGIGKTSIYDTYLSNLEYKGTTVGLLHEQIRMTGILKGNVSAQHLFNLNFSWTDNEAETASDYSGFIDYAYGLHYRFRPAKNLQLFAGAQANGILGFIYNSRNGNNPATAKAHLNLNLSGIATYRFQVYSQPINLRYQVNAPFLGIMFSPHYGQSYYEISLGDDDHLVHFASYHNQVILRNSLSLEIPLDFITLRLMYVNSIYETRVNEIDTRIHNNSFMIGFSKEVFTVSGKKQAKGKYKRVFE